MDSIVQSILNYVGRGALLTVRQLLILLGPVLILALILDQLSQFVRTRAARILGLDFYTYLTAPGVMVHELGHAFFCVIFLHRIIRMRLFSPRGDGSLGSVQHSYNPRSTYQRIGNFFIGTGPIWLGTALVSLLAWLLLGSAASHAVRQVNNSSNVADLATEGSQVAGLAWQLFTLLLRPALLSTWQFWIVAYLIFCIGSHITLSRPDINGAARGFVSLVVFMLVFNLLTLSFDGQFSLQACQHLFQGSVIFYAAIALVICLNLSLAVLLFVLSLVFRRR